MDSLLVIEWDADDPDVVFVAGRPVTIGDLDGYLRTLEEGLE